MPIRGDGCTAKDKCQKLLQEKENNEMASAIDEHLR